MENHEKPNFKDLANNLKGVKDNLKGVADNFKDASKNLGKNFDVVKKEAQDVKENISLEKIITTAIQVPGVKVTREDFLREQFKDAPPELLDLIIKEGPIKAQCPREKLKRMASKILQKRTLASTGASFLAGIPGGLAMAATIPADMLQFYGVALGMAQELIYLYGEEDLWADGAPDCEKITNQLILYCGVMFGATGAAQTVRVLSSSLAKQALKKIPQKALTKTFYYPIIKSIAKMCGAHMTKDVFAKGVSKAIPIVGGVVSGGLTLASMLPMGNRLIDTLDKAHFEYTENDFDADWKDIMKEYEESDEIDEQGDALEVEATIVDAVDVDESIEASGATTEEDVSQAKSSNDTSSILEKINQAKTMLDAGIISEEEFTSIKAKLISEM